MNIKIKRFLAIVVALVSTAACSAPPSFGQRTPASPEQKERRDRQMRYWVEADVKEHPKSRMLVTFRDGTQAAGRIREVREKDFILRQDTGFPDRTIAYDEIEILPQKITPMAEKIALWVGLSPFVVICMPLMLLAAALGLPD